MVCLHLGHTGPRRAAHPDRPRPRAKLPRGRAQHRRGRTILRRRHRGHLGRSACRRHSRPRSRFPPCWRAALLAGGLWVAVPVGLRLRYGVLEVISTLLLNFVAEALVSFMVQGPLQESPAHLSAERPDRRSAARLPAPPRHPAACGTRSWRSGALCCCGMSSRAPSGVPSCGRWARARARPRSAGGSTAAGWARSAPCWCRAHSPGWPAGSRSSGVSYALFQNLSPGYGFTAIAVALLARLHPAGVVVDGPAVRRARGRRRRDAARRRRAGRGGVRGRGGGDRGRAAGRGGAAPGVAPRVAA